MTREMIASGASLRMRPAEYERKVRMAMGGPLSKQERDWCEMHADMGTDPAKLANMFRVLRKIEANKRQRREADELYMRTGIEL